MDRMTAAVVTIGLVCLCLVAALVVRERDHGKLTIDLNERAAVERSELATRIQHPELAIFPRRAVEQPEPPEDAAELAKVGTVIPFRDDGDQSA